MNTKKLWGIPKQPSKPNIRQENARPSTEGRAYFMPRQISLLFNK